MKELEKQLIYESSTEVILNADKKFCSLKGYKAKEAISRSTQAKWRRR